MYNDLRLLGGLFYCCVCVCVCVCDMCVIGLRCSSCCIMPAATPMYINPRLSSAMVPRHAHNDQGKRFIVSQEAIAIDQSISLKLET